MAIIPFGEQAVRVIFGDRIDPSIQAQISRFLRYFDRLPFPGFIEYVPAYTNIAFYYDPQKVLVGVHGGQTAQQTVIDYLEACYTAMDREPCADERIERRTVRIPVCYGGAFGPDLDVVASYHQMSTEEVIRRHTAPEYLVYMLGFAPGFPFLGGLPEELATPRRESPRLKIAAGSVGIAGRQTGAYPLQSPGGWQIIGRTPTQLFTPDGQSPTLLHAGDLVRFESITEEQFLAQKGGQL
ncbi:inhibitor of KinA [Sporolactobacillus spathodeae]|uniref:Inhibitor of KinA n=1 Tax=Sporolactobacillus spathodeae TaxID=1465502 RepID=A0ABS2Q5I8_9BACL|nr:5-oxoprolinase subunit PxpB [Sporolactobacillus spathodeae]MBM7656876.1 inhibitor of KinA [Sporolactobacillus spathodeae]